MKAKILTLAAAAAITLGAAGLATTASAAMPATNLSGVATATGANVQNVHYNGYYHRHRRYRHRCRRLYRLGFVHGYPWARRAWYRNCRYYRGYRRYRGPRFGIHFGY